MTTGEGRAALARELDGAPPGELDRLDDDRLAALALLVAAAKARQSEALAEGTDAALRHVPRLLRGPFRRALGA